MNSLLNKYASIKKISKYMLNFKINPWITSGIQNPISLQKKLLNKFINKLDPQIRSLNLDK